MPDFESHQEDKEVLQNDQQLKALLRATSSIAVIGIKGVETEDAFRVPLYLQQQGYRIIPVNPKWEKSWVNELIVISTPLRPRAFLWTSSTFFEPQRTSPSTWMKFSECRRLRKPCGCSLGYTMVPLRPGCVQRAFL